MACNQGTVRKKAIGEHRVSRQLLCSLEDIPDGCAREFFVNGQALFVVKDGGQLQAYENRCPHLGITLNLVPHQFLTLDKQHIQCSSHGALFDIGSGRCIAGPCTGDTLKALNCELVDGNIYLLP